MSVYAPVLFGKVSVRYLIAAPQGQRPSRLKNTDPSPLFTTRLLGQVPGLNLGNNSCSALKKTSCRHVLEEKKRITPTLPWWSTAYKWSLAKLRVESGGEKVRQAQPLWSTGTSKPSTSKIISSFLWGALREHSGNSPFSYISQVYLNDAPPEVGKQWWFSYSHIMGMGHIQQLAEGLYPSSL